MLNLDTHILLRALGGELTPREEAVLADDSWSIASIVFWEINKLAELSRIEIDLDDVDLIRTLARLHVWPLDLDVCRTSAVTPRTRSSPPPASCTGCRW